MHKYTRKNVIGINISVNSWWEITNSFFNIFLIQWSLIIWHYYASFLLVSTAKLEILQMFFTHIYAAFTTKSLIQI